MIEKEDTNEDANEDATGVEGEDSDPRAFMCVTTTAHRGDADNGARSALKARASLYYDALHWRTEETHKGKIDRLMGRRKRGV